LVVAIVGGAIFSLVQGDLFGPNVEISGFDSGDVILTDSNVAEDFIEFQVRNGGSETIEIEKVVISNPDSREIVLNSFTDIDVGDERTVGLTNISSDHEGEFDFEVKYSQGNLEGLTQSGSIKGDLQIPEDGELWENPMKRNVCSNIIEEMWNDEDELYEVNNLAELQCMANDKDGDYSVKQDIDAGQTRLWKQGFEPIGSEESPFNAEIHGNENTITGLEIVRPETDRVGMISYGSGMTIEHLSMNNSKIKGDRTTGILGGEVRDSLIYRTYANGDVIGGSRRVGVLVGHGRGSEVLRSHTSGTVDGPGRRTAGIIGRYGTINQSYSKATVNGGRAGGLAGRSTTIVDSYYSGEITGSSVQTGGIQGRGSSINRTFTINAPNDGQESSQRHALVGQGGAEYSYWNSDFCLDCDGTRSDSPTAEGLSTEEMTGESAEENLKGFDFEDTWQTVENDYPRLQWE